MLQIIFIEHKILMKISGKQGVILAKTCDTEFVALDLETTGLDPRIDRIVEVGAVVFRGNEVLGIHETLVDPGIRIHPRVSAIHGITNKMVTGSPTPEEAVAELGKFMGDRPLVIQNAPFDLGFIEEAGRLLSVSKLDNAVFDTCRIAPLVFPGMPGYSLGRLSRALGIRVKREHRAVDDSLAAMGIFLKCLEKVDPDGKMDYRDFEDGFSLKAISDLERSGLDLQWPEGSEMLQETLGSSKKVSIVYCSGSGITTRRLITPTGLVMVGGKVMLEAWCHLRGESRTFRFDRISEVRPEE